MELSQIHLYDVHSVKKDTKRSSNTQLHLVSFFTERTSYKRIWDSSILSSICTKIWSCLFCWFTFFLQILIVKLFLFWFAEVAEVAEQSYVTNLYKSCKKTQRIKIKFWFRQKQECNCLVLIHLAVPCFARFFFKLVKLMIKKK